MEKVEHQEAEKLRFLRKAWQDGVESGDAIVDSDRHIAQLEWPKDEGEA